MVRCAALSAEQSVEFVASFVMAATMLTFVSSSRLRVVRNVCRLQSNTTSPCGHLRRVRDREPPHPMYHLRWTINKHLRYVLLNATVDSRLLRQPECLPKRTATRAYSELPVAAN